MPDQNVSRIRARCAYASPQTLNPGHYHMQYHSGISYHVTHFPVNSTECTVNDLAIGVDHVADGRAYKALHGILSTRA